MDIEILRNHLLSKPVVTEGEPFGPQTLVYKVMDKMWAILPLDRMPPQVGLKCDPARAISLRESYASVVPGWHLNKKHWNTLFIEEELPDDLILELADHSYDLVVRGLPKKVQALINT
jgi:predicted DNA-binding protein (MmcQ/YjbR family)